MLDYYERRVAFDSNVLTYFLDGNRGIYSLCANDALAAQRIASVRLFLYCQAFIVPTVRAEAERISAPAKLEEHIRFIDYSFPEGIPDDSQQAAIRRRANELLAHHPDLDDCRVLAEVVQDGGIPVLITMDKDFRKNLASHTCIRLESPAQCWESFKIARGTPPHWTPLAPHPLAKETWWRWE
jgi:predicted nucleic acid-binding protein